MTAQVENPRGVAALRSNLRDVWVNRNVRRIQLAFAGSEIGEWAYAMALLVWAYQEGGAALVGVWAGARALLAAFTGPIGGAIADRMSRRTFMLVNNAIRLVLVLVTAAAIYLDLGIWAVIVPGTLLIMVGASFRSAQGGLLPSLVDSPKQLTSANATAEMIDSTAVFVGPAIAGLLLGVVGILPVVLLNALGFLFSLILVSGVHVAREMDLPEDLEATAEDERVGAEAGAAAKESVWVEVTDGFRTIFRDRDLLAVAGLLAVNGVLAGVLNVLVVLVAAEMIGDPSAVGWLMAIMGVATVIGSMVMLALAGHARLGRLMAIGVLGWCLPLVVLGVVPELVVIIAAFVVIGLSDPLVNIAFGTIPPRLVPDRVLSRVFAAIESLFIGSAALGAFITPLLVSLFGLQTTVVALGVAGVIVTAVCALRVPHLDARLVAPRGLDILRSVPLFAPLPPTMVEQMAHKFEPVSAASGEVIVREGEISDLFYVVESGEVEVSQNGLVIRTETVGDVFGEIGLLRDVPRTATVTAATDTELLTLSREEFLALMAGERRVRALTSDLATRRLSG